MSSGNALSSRYLLKRQS